MTYLNTTLFSESDFGEEKPWVYRMQVVSIMSIRTLHSKKPPISESYRYTLTCTNVYSRQISGSLLAATSLQALVGATGVIGFLLKYVGPLTIGPVITLIGISLFSALTKPTEAQWGIAIL